VRKLVLYFCLAGLALGQTPQPTDTVLAWKPQTPYMHAGSGWPSMPHNLWTNSILWLTAESPVLNAGATNANWICYAKTCTGNAYQTGTGYQPTSIVTNGIKALYFDGTDDFLLYPTSPRFSGTNSFTLTMWMDLAGYWPASNTTATVGGVNSVAGDQRSWAIQLRGPTASTQPDQMTTVQSLDGATAFGLSTTAYIPRASLTNGWTHVALIVRDGRYFRYMANGVPVQSEFDRLVAVYASTAPFSIAASGTGIGPASLNLADIKFHGSALATNVVTDIFNAEKARYGK
jgi:hypothetical protein